MNANGPHNVGIIFKGNVNLVMKYAILDTKRMIIYIIWAVCIFVNKTSILYTNINIIMIYYKNKA